MRRSELPLADDFPAPDRKAWLALVGASLKGASFEKRLVSHTRDGLAVQPLYEPDANAAVLSARPAPAADIERPWDLQSLIDHSDPARANTDALENLSNGAASVLLRLDPSGETGIAAVDQDALARALDGVLLDLAPIGLDAGLMGPDAANWLAVLAKGAPGAPLRFNLDPLSVLAETGATPGPVEAHITTAAQTAARHAGAYPKACLFLASGRCVHEAGGSEGQELGFMAACALTYVRAMTDAGLTLEDAFGRVTLGLSLEADYFASIAKLRAAREIWARMAGACGLSVPARIEARSSRRMLSRLDPWVNLLRLTAAGFSGGVGGADIVTLDPFTQPLGRAGPLARRQARNTQLVLMEEAHLGRVADPAGGAAYLEALTDGFARAGWSVMQTIETLGGPVAALKDGRLAREVAAVRAVRQADVATRKTGLVGVSEFPNLGEAAVAVDPVDPRPFARSVDLRAPGEDSHCERLQPMRLSEPFEALRESALALGSPQVFLATPGPASEHGARLGFSQGLFAAGGVAGLTGAVDAYARGGPALAVICGSDERYAAEAAQAARALKAAGAREVWLAGKPGEQEAALRAAGVDAFIFVGADIVAVLTRALEILA